MDEFFIQILNEYLSEIQDCLVYSKKYNGPEYEEIREDYQFIIEDITNLLKSVKTIDDLAEMDEDEIGYVFEYLDDYATNFVISSESHQKALDQKKYKKIDELLSLFFDEDDEEDYEE